ncbi:Chlorophyll(ide) b reductase NOL, chloroplastic [Vitis vinifera]|uniref:Chlorophyll(Ide) b reductase NOL, chloroplastic n=1 Tax=Vitis vinifera TaxID=29760 RepID=A0A438JB39_VITVI|nr:Chlorophyll(ide) b reductase NOL, chloroplastic [Vitis vinifera]
MQSESAVVGSAEYVLVGVAELQMQDVKNVVVHNLSPGMVTTDLLMSGATTKQVECQVFINVLAEPAEVVAEYLVPNIRSIPVNGSTKPTYIRFLTGLKAYSQIFSVKK